MDWALLVGGAVPALLFGVAFGNLFLGLSFHFDEIERISLILLAIATVVARTLAG